MKTNRYNLNLLICSWVSIIVLLGLTFISLFVISIEEQQSNSPCIILVERPSTFETNPNTPEQTVNVNINGSNSNVNVYIEKKPKYSKTVTRNLYASRIVQLARQEWSKKDARHFSLKDAIKLVDKISNAAKNNNLNESAAFLIVAIESSFRVDAYNKGGSAYGLCQVTELCLQEYNDKNSKGHKYSLADMYDADKNLEVGFWYYNRILTHYDNYFGYIDHSSFKTELRDAYIAYNCGVTAFYRVGRPGRNSLRNGVYPEAMYGAQKGDVYKPMLRFNHIYEEWI